MPAIVKVYAGIRRRDLRSGIRFAGMARSYSRFRSTFPVISALQ
jgi:hypothetical protein